ncbi:MAG: cytochrome ubiquinol oxidase subunit I, partial [Candidatus Korarchaeum sp.]|nr:cytochrome ubiquinol oxidase subunit I [Candidatus Korarchaeum sp.]
AAGTLCEFGLVLIWPNLLEAAGRYIFFPLYAEIFAFLMEITFIYLLVFGWNKIGIRAKILLSLLALFGAWFSGALIMSVNSYMVAPTGIVAAYDPLSGWKHDRGFPKVLLVVPNDIVKVLDLDKLTSLGMEVVSSGENGVSVLLPSKIVSRLISESWSNVKVGESVLSLVVRSETLGGLKDLSVKEVIDTIVTNTIRSVGYTTVTFLSPVYLGSILHALGSAVTVTGFTILGAYSLLLLRSKNGKKEYYLAGLRLGAFMSLIAIAVQGLVFGHALGAQIAENNPEKLAAMEGTSESIFSLARFLGIERLMSFIIYGSFDAKIPDYDSISVDYCTLDGVPAITDCRPPLMIHYLYYTKTGLSLILGFYALIYVLLTIRGNATSLLLLRMNLATPVVAQFVSFLGWAVREMGRKPWSIYGIMTVDVAHTANPLSYSLIALIMICVTVALILAAWKLLYEPSIREV